MSSTAVKIRRASMIKTQKMMRGHTKLVRGVAHLPGGQRIITCSRDGSLRLWDLESCTQLGEDWRDEGDEIGVWSMALSPNGRTIASSYLDGTVRLWDVETRMVITKWKEPSEDVNSICWSPDGLQVVIGSADGTARVWDVESGEPLMVQGLNPIQTGHESVYVVSYSPKATKIATGGYNEDGIEIWDAKIGKLLSTIKHEYAVWSLAWTSDENKLISGSGNGSLRIFDTATWHETAVLEGHNQVVEAITLFRNDRLLASTSWDKTARLWNLDTNISIGLPLKHEKDVEYAAFSADGKMLSTACADENAYVWNIHAILKAAGLENLLSIPAQQSGLKQPEKSFSDGLVNTTRRPPPLQLPGLLDDLQDYDPFPNDSSLHPHPFVHRRRSAFAPFLESRRLQVRLPPLFHPSLPDTDELIELQQRPRPSTSSIRSPHVVEVAAQQDNQVLHVARRPERASDKAKRIKNSTWWNRFVLFLCCVPHYPVDGPTLRAGYFIHILERSTESCMDASRKSYLLACSLELGIASEHPKPSAGLLAFQCEVRLILAQSELGHSACGAHDVALRSGVVSAEHWRNIQTSANPNEFTITSTATEPQRSQTPSGCVTWSHIPSALPPMPMKQTNFNNDQGKLPPPIVVLVLSKLLHNETSRHCMLLADRKQLVKMRNA
ncbi:WD40-repeat-containing domain protein [Suillus subalutaceus]|uniref:WD40-repeat-containing domain protein n=1 Tax=Suillus subalutaceus TaxID=48586 RepID=UPI001B864326|nr:WD40-repeat-containing domain protein [Suillus subalutaceus]KAG1871376.1 WD40-repeat-containing domain protein [Suillus subalutaceus]